VSDAAEKLFAGPCEFVAGAATLEAIPALKRPEVAFVGRSNVGKSSLVNALCRRRNLARVSQNPGATKQINFFELGGRLTLADLPGYGFARTSKALAREWQHLIFSYLRGRQNLRRVILLIDARRGPMDFDKQAMDILDEAAVSYLVTLTKADKLEAGEMHEVRAQTESALKGHTASYPDILTTSASTGAGLEALREHIAALTTG